MICLFVREKILINLRDESMELKMLEEATSGYNLPTSTYYMGMGRRLLIHGPKEDF